MKNDFDLRNVHPVPSAWGVPPSDLLVRWKRLRGQPISWEPDINDGVRMNIRPFLASDLPNGKKGAGIKQWGGTNKKKKGRFLDGRTWDELPRVIVHPEKTSSLDRTRRKDRLSRRLS